MMDGLNGFALLTTVMFIVLLYRFNSRFGKAEREFNEMKKRMDQFLKAQENKISAEANAQEEPLKEEPLKEDPSKEEAFMKEKPKNMAEDRRDEALNDVPYQAAITSEKLITSEELTTLEKQITPEELTTPEKRITPKKKEINYEKFIGENLFGKIGILIFVIGIGFFVKYAIDQDWINEIFRTVLGFLVGSVLLVVAERLQKKYRTFSSLLAGGAFAVFYLTVAIAFHYYHLFSQTVAFILLVGITVFMSILSILYDRRELAVIALVGGFLAPFIVSSGEGSYRVLFTYLSVLNLGMFGLSIYKKWSELPVISFVFTYLVMAVFMLTSYTGNPDSTVISVHLFMFSTLFYFIFLLPVLSILRVEDAKMNKILLSTIVVNNFLYLLFGVLFLKGMNLSFEAEGLLSLFIAIVNLGLVLWLRKSKQDYKFLIYAMLGLVLTFVSITVPMQLDGNYITLFWASEMVLLLWLYVKSKIRVYEYGALVMVCLTFISFLMGVAYALHNTSETIFLNSSFVTSLYMGLATGAFALLMGRYRPFFSTTRVLCYDPWNAIMLLLSVVVLYFTFMLEFNSFSERATRIGAMLLFTTASISVVCYAFRKRFPLEQYNIPYILGLGINVLMYIITIWQDPWNMSFCPILLRWLAVAFVIANLYDVARRYYASVGLRTRFTVYLNILATLCWLTMARSFLWHIGIDDFNAGFSVSLSIAGFVQMGLGMRLHQKVMRIISLSTFGIVLLKLVLVDLWAMPTIGKIIVFIILGLILLILSFLYQKLKDVLFKNDEDEIS